MKKQLLKEIIEKKEKKIEFAIVTDLQNGESCIFEKNKPIDNNFEKYKDKIDLNFSSKKDGIIEGTNIFVESSISSNLSNFFSSYFTLIFKIFKIIGNTS